ncbi:MAG: hypothetical protein K9N35_00660 [Candidatus Marinimicrobia bacterium]|nr:hypothetical protein [Candidatus Neomarinimicrobiota bacterium]
MPDKKEEPVEIEEIVEIPETVDFDNSESRMKFLKSQLNDLLDGINNVYGQNLMEELLKRLEKTVESFNEEVSGLIERLKEGKINEKPEVSAEVNAQNVNEEGESLEEGEEPEKTFEQQEAEDSDIIARMRARIKKD